MTYKHHKYIILSLIYLVSCMTYANMPSFYNQALNAKLIATSLQSKIPILLKRHNLPNTNYSMLLPRGWQILKIGKNTVYQPKQSTWPRIIISQIPKENYSLDYIFTRWVSNLNLTQVQLTKKGKVNQHDAIYYNYRILDNKSNIIPSTIVTMGLWIDGGQNITFVSCTTISNYNSAGMRMRFSQILSSIKELPQINQKQMI